MARLSSDAEKIDVAYVAYLARLALSDDERESFQRQLEQIIGYVDQLKQVDLEGIEPTAHAAPIQNVFREDEARPGLDHERVMDNAPRHQAGHFVVPRILE